MARDYLVKIGNYVLPEPSTYNGNTGTLVDAGRNAEGKFIGSVIRDDVAKVELTWRFLTVKQWAEINKLFKISAGGSFINYVTFFDQAEGDYVSRYMYVSDRSAGMWRRHPKTGEILGWTDCRLSLIEV